MAVIAAVINILIGIYVMRHHIVINFFDEDHQLLSIGVTMIQLIGTIKCILMTLSNFLTRIKLRAVLRLHLKFDARTEELFNPKHGQQLVVLTVFWILENSLVLDRSLQALTRSFSAFGFNFYLTSIFLNSKWVSHHSDVPDRTSIAQFKKSNREQRKLPNDRKYKNFFSFAWPNPWDNETHQRRFRISIVDFLDSSVGDENVHNVLSLRNIIRHDHVVKRCGLQYLQAIRNLKSRNNFFGVLFGRIYQSRGE